MLNERLQLVESRTRVALSKIYTLPGEHVFLREGEGETEKS